MKILYRFVFVSFFCGVLASCATVMRENSQIVPLTANTEEVNIKILNKAGNVVFEGKTPTTLSLKTSASGYFNPEKYRVVASKEGYKDEEVVIDWHVSGWYYIGNLVIGGLIGYLIVDPLTGDMYYLDEQVHLNMQPLR